MSNGKPSSLYIGPCYMSIMTSFWHPNIRLLALH
ncbi:hypothetical protein GQ607_017333 [Colletotrichum asianum]|uniref:Uncharacterized protein n=1 Tax=Colletotrichum asianum TaxID=702518 RepID=A0A8H3VU59_9PEZI|nr:hypothetical protein GQ607_017333 [Colletotrichum asianum]